MRENSNDRTIDGNSMSTEMASNVGERRKDGSVILSAAQSFDDDIDNYKLDVADEDVDGSVHGLRRRDLSMIRLIDQDKNTPQSREPEGASGLVEGDSSAISSGGNEIE